MSKRTLVLMLVALLALVSTAGEVLAAGGSAPPPPGLTLVTTKDVTATIVVDPHGFGTTTAFQGSIILSRKHFNDGVALFNIPLFASFGAGTSGCDLSLTGTRVIGTLATYRPMSDWVPQNVLDALFQQVGITISPALQPAVTAVSAQSCAPPPASDAGAFNPGILVLDANIGFYAGTGVSVPK